MTSFEFVPDEIYVSLPALDGQKFIKLVTTALGSAKRIEGGLSNSTEAGEMRSQLMATIQGWARICQISGLDPFTPSSSLATYSTFTSKLAEIMAEQRLLAIPANDPYSVELGRGSKAKIRDRIQSLRSYISQADLPQEKREKLYGKLDELLRELEGSRFNFARFMAISASIMGTLGGTAGLLANAPKVSTGITYIIELVGVEKHEEEEEQKRLSPPLLAITGPERKRLHGPASNSSGDNSNGNEANS